MYWKSITSTSKLRSNRFYSGQVKLDNTVEIHSFCCMNFWLSAKCAQDYFRTSLMKLSVVALWDKNRTENTNHFHS